MKGNHPGLAKGLRRMFRDLEAAPEAKRQRLGHATASSVDKGHGRRERRRAQVRKVPRGHWGWDGLAQVVEVSRRTLRGGRWREEKAYWITSLGAAEASAGRLLRLVRDHWAIEALHHARDVTLGEDRCQVSDRTAAQALAAARNLALALLPTDRARGIHLPECRAAVALDFRPTLLQLTTLKL